MTLTCTICKADCTRDAIMPGGSAGHYCRACWSVYQHPVDGEPLASATLGDVEALRAALEAALDARDKLAMESRSTREQLTRVRRAHESLQKNVDAALGKEHAYPLQRVFFLEKMAKEREAPAAKASKPSEVDVIEQVVTRAEFEAVVAERDEARTELRQVVELLPVMEARAAIAFGGHVGEYVRAVVDAICSERDADISKEKQRADQAERTVAAMREVLWNVTATLEATCSGDTVDAANRLLASPEVAAAAEKWVPRDEHERALDDAGASGREATLLALGQAHPRALKLLRQGVPFLVVRADEVYARSVAALIRHVERALGKWTDDDEAWMVANVSPSLANDEWQSAPPTIVAHHHRLMADIAEVDALRARVAALEAAAGLVAARLGCRAERLDGMADDDVDRDFERSILVAQVATLSAVLPAGALNGLGPETLEEVASLSTTEATEEPPHLCDVLAGIEKVPR